MSNQTFRIKPLVWDGYDRDGVFMTASTPFGSYRCECDPGESNCTWGFCFDEYYDEDEFECDSIEDGMFKAQAHWVNRIMGALEPITTTITS